MTNDRNRRGESDTVDHPTMVRHEWEEPFQPSVTIVEAVAAATGRTATTLPPLQKQIDPDALDTLVTRGESADVSISFRYAGTAIVIDDDGTIEVRVGSDQ